jgi:hypothetical protein
MTRFDRVRLAKLRRTVYKNLRLDLLFSHSLCHIYCQSLFIEKTNVTKMPGTWFLAPDFTFTTDGPLQLGMVISHWSKPSNVLADLSARNTSEIALPGITSIVEPSHSHKRSTSRTNGGGIWSKFEGIASLGASGAIGKSTTIEYGATDHEIRLFSGPLLPETATKIVEIPSVRAHVDSGMFGRRAIYIVTGIRIATSSFTVATENGTERSFEIMASSPVGGPVPVEVGGKVNRAVERSVVDMYETAPHIIFAYRLHVIRTRRSGHETEIFEHKSAFMTGARHSDDESLIVVEATEAEINEDIELIIAFEKEDCGEDGYCICRGPG